MKTIDINELKALYQVELDDAHTRTVKMISDKDLSNCNLEDAYGAMLDWNIDNQRQMGLFDDFIDKSLNTNAKEEKHLVMFRDSFGSSLAPLMAEGYSKITVIDIRYIQSGLLGNFAQFEDADVLFIYSTVLLNNSQGLK